MVWEDQGSTAGSVRTPAKPTPQQPLHWCALDFSVPCSQRTRNICVTDHTGLLTSCREGDCTPWDLWGVSVRGCQKEPLTGFGFHVGDLVEGPRKPGICARLIAIRKQGTALQLGTLWVPQWPYLCLFLDKIMKQPCFVSFYPGLRVTSEVDSLWEFSVQQNKVAWLWASHRFMIILRSSHKSQISSRWQGLLFLSLSSSFGQGQMTSGHRTLIHNVQIFTLVKILLVKIRNIY